MLKSSILFLAILLFGFTHLFAQDSISTAGVTLYYPEGWNFYERIEKEDSTIIQLQSGGMFSNKQLHYCLFKGGQNPRTRLFDYLKEMERKSGAYSFNVGNMVDSGFVGHKGVATTFRLAYSMFTRQGQNVVYLEGDAYSFPYKNYTAIVLGIRLKDKHWKLVRRTFAKK